MKRTDSLQISLIAPNSGKYAGLNSYSIAVKLSYGERSFLITGDAEADSEKEMLEKFDVKADVLKCGHHGSSTSTSAAFLKAVSPRYAVLSCGADNKYGHPHKMCIRDRGTQGVRYSIEAMTRPKAVTLNLAAN